MDKIRIITVLCILGLASLALSGCTTFNNFKEAFIDKPSSQSQTISIGVYEPMNGEDKEGAKAELAGIELAHEMMPEADGLEVNLIYADNSSDIAAAETAINTLLAKEPEVVLGSYGSIYSLVAGEYVAEAETPAIAITNTNPLVTRNNSYYFRVCYIDATQGRLLAQYLDSTGEKKTGVLLPEKDDAATAMTTAFVDEFKKLTEDDDAITYYEKYTTGDTDFTEHLKALKKSKVKSVLLPGEYTDAANIIKQASEVGLDVTFLGTMKWGGSDFLKAITTDENGEPTYIVDSEKLAFVQFFAAKGGKDKATISKTRKAFLDAYHQKYGQSEEPDEAVALGFDAYGIAIDAVLRASKETGEELPSGEAIRDVLMSDGYEFDGASGVIRFNKRGDPKKTAYISTWAKGTIKAIYTIDADQQ